VIGIVTGIGIEIAIVTEIVTRIRMADAVGTIIEIVVVIRFTMSLTTTSTRPFTTRGIMAAMATARALISVATKMVSSPAPTTHAAGKATILSVHTSSVAAWLVTAQFMVAEMSINKRIATGFCAVMMKAIETGRDISVAEVSIAGRDSRPQR